MDKCNMTNEKKLDKSLPSYFLVHISDMQFSKNSKYQIKVKNNKFQYRKIWQIKSYKNENRREKEKI